MKVLIGGASYDLGITEAKPTVGIIDYSRRVTDAFGVTTVVPRDFARRMSVRMAVPSHGIDALHQRLTVLRAQKATWQADDRYTSLSFEGFYKDFSVDLNTGALGYCTLSVEGLAEPDPAVDTFSDPAPDNRLSSLRLLQPVAISDATLTASNVPENDAPAWAAGTAYAVGAKVIRGHRVYESLAADNHEDPTLAPTAWLATGPTNRWAMFDQALGTATTLAGSIVVSINTSINAIAALDVSAGTIRVQADGYDRTIAVVSGRPTLFLDLPSVSDATVTIAGAGTVAVGTLLIGRVTTLGTTAASPTASINDFSRKDADDFGNIEIVERAWSKRMEAKALIRTDALDMVFGRLAAVRTRPSLWIGDSALDSLTIYGFFRDFTIEVGENVSTLSLSIEGLSLAAPPGVSVADQLAAIVDDVEQVEDKVEDLATGAADTQAYQDAQVSTADGLITAGPLNWRAQQRVAQQLAEWSVAVDAILDRAVRLARDPGALVTAFNALKLLVTSADPEFGQPDNNPVTINASEWATKRAAFLAAQKLLTDSLDKLSVGLETRPIEDWTFSGIARNGSAGTGAGFGYTKASYRSPQIATTFKKGTVWIGFRKPTAVMDGNPSTLNYAMRLRLADNKVWIKAEGADVEYSTEVWPNGVPVQLVMYDNGSEQSIRFEVKGSVIPGASAVNGNAGQQWVPVVIVENAAGGFEALTLTAASPIPYSAVKDGPPANATVGSNIVNPNTQVSGATATADGWGYAFTGNNAKIYLVGSDGTPADSNGAEFLSITVQTRADTGVGSAYVLVMPYNAGGASLQGQLVDARKGGGIVQLPTGTVKYIIVQGSDFTSGSIEMTRAVVVATQYRDVDPSKIVGNASDEGVDLTYQWAFPNDGRAPTAQKPLPDPDSGSRVFYPGDADATVTSSTFNSKYVIINYSPFGAGRIAGYMDLPLSGGGTAKYPTVGPASGPVSGTVVLTVRLSKGAVSTTKTYTLYNGTPLAYGSETIEIARDANGVYEYDTITATIHSTIAAAAGDYVAGSAPSIVLRSRNSLADLDTQASAQVEAVAWPAPKVTETLMGGPLGYAVTGYTLKETWKASALGLTEGGDGNRLFLVESVPSGSPYDGQVATVVQTAVDQSNTITWQRTGRANENGDPNAWWPWAKKLDTSAAKPNVAAGNVLLEAARPATLQNIETSKGTAKFLDGETAVTRGDPLLFANENVPQGAQLCVDPEFTRSSATDFNIGSAYYMYDNSGSGKVKLSVLTGQTDAPNGTGRVMKVSYDGTGSEGSFPQGPTPGFGGYTTLLDPNTATGVTRQGYYRPGTTIYFAIVAKIPVGRSLQFHSNHTGANSTAVWLGSRAGTGVWQRYILRLIVGATAAAGNSFGTTGFFAIEGGPNTAFDWFVARHDILEAHSTTVFAGSGLRDESGVNLSGADIRTAVGTAKYLDGEGPWTRYNGLAPGNVAGQVSRLQTDGYMTADSVYLPGQDLLSNRFPREGGADVTGTNTAKYLEGAQALAYKSHVTYGTNTVDGFGHLAAMYHVKLGAPTSTGSALVTENGFGTSDASLITDQGAAKYLLGETAITRAAVIVPSLMTQQSGDNIIPDGSMTDAKWWANGNPGITNFATSPAGFDQQWDLAANHLVISPGYVDAYSPFFDVQPGATYRVDVRLHYSGDFGGWLNPVIHMPAVAWWSLRHGAGIDPTDPAYSGAAGTTQKLSFIVKNLTDQGAVQWRQWQFRFRGNITSGAVFMQVRIVRVATLGSTLVRQDGSTPINDNDAITNLGTAKYLDGAQALAYRATIDSDALLGGTIANRIAPHPLNANYLTAASMAYPNGAGVDGLQPQEAGSNVTENRTAKYLQGAKALTYKDKADWNTDLSSVPTTRLFKNLMDTRPIEAGGGFTTGVYNSGNFYDNDSACNFLTTGIGPMGTAETMLKLVANSDGNASGGWNYAFEPSDGFDPRKSYRYVNFFKTEPGASGSIYLGIRGIVIDIGNGGYNGNFYFWAEGAANFTPGKWYVAVGIAHGSEYAGGHSGLSGVYDVETGQRVSVGYDCKHYDPYAGHRAYQYYSQPGSTVWFTRPSITEITGAISLADLMLNSANLNSQQRFDLVVPGYGRPENGADVTGNHTAKYLQGSGWGAYASETQASNAQVATGSQNCAFNSGFAQGLKGFYATRVYGSTNFGLNYPGYFGARQVAYVEYQGVAANGDVVVDIATEGAWSQAVPFAEAKKYMMPVKQGDRIGVRVLAACHRSRMTLYALCYDKNGNMVTAPNTGTIYPAPGGAWSSGSNMQEVSFTWDVDSASIFYASLMVRMIGTGEDYPYLFFAEPQLVKLAPGQTVMPPYTPGTSDPLADGTVDSLPFGLTTNFQVGGGMVTASTPFYVYQPRYLGAKNVSPSAEWSGTISAGLDAFLDNGSGSLTRGRVSITALKAMYAYVTTTSTHEGKTFTTTAFLEKSYPIATNSNQQDAVIVPGNFLATGRQNTTRIANTTNWTVVTAEFTGYGYNPGDGSSRCAFAFQATGISEVEATSANPCSIEYKIQMKDFSGNWVDKATIGSSGELNNYTVGGNRTLTTANISVVSSIPSGGSIETMRVLARLSNASSVVRIKSVAVGTSTTTGVIPEFA